jgi:pyruvate-formate lyase-activating enzyme
MVLKHLQGYSGNLCMGGFGSCLYVKITNNCNCSCAHCIEKDGHCPTESASVETMIEKTNLVDFDSILILGGEPYLSEKLVPYAKGVVFSKSKKRRNIYVTTNGSVFSPEVDFELAKYLTGLNISINSVSEAKNAEVYGRNISFSEIAQAINRYKSLGVKVRINANLVKGYIDSFEEILDAVKLAESWNADEIRFNELQGNNNQGLFVDSSKFFSFLNSDPFLQGCVQSIDFPSFQVKVSIKQVCSHCNYLKDQSNQKYLPVTHHTTKVLYSDGTLFNGWLMKKPINHTNDVCHRVEISCHKIDYNK